MANPNQPKAKKSRKKSGSGKKSGARKSRAKGSTTTVPTTTVFEEPHHPLTGQTSPAPVAPARRARAATGSPKRKMPARELMAVESESVSSASVPQLAHGEHLTLAQIYETLAALLVPYARKMESEMHPKIGFCLKAKSARTGRETHFGAVQSLADGVAYHLFPLYGHPDLLQNVSPELFNRMRGKTCFHFEDLHAGIVAELAELTRAGFERFLSDGVLS
jgi:hypothetical protein